MVQIPSPQPIKNTHPFSDGIFLGRNSKNTKNHVHIAHILKCFVVNFAIRDFLHKIVKNTYENIGFYTQNIFCV